MTLRLKMQKIREGEKHEGYRISLPKQVIQAQGWEDMDFLMKLNNKGITLTPVKKVKK